MLLVLKLVMEVAADWPEGVGSPLLAIASLGERSRRVVVGMVGGGLNWTRHREQCELAQELVVWCCVCQHAAEKRVDLHSTEPTNCVMMRAYLTSKNYPRTIDHGRNKDT
jgi:hypothetical protein